MTGWSKKTRDTTTKCPTTPHGRTPTKKRPFVLTRRRLSPWPRAAYRPLLGIGGRCREILIVGHTRFEGALERGGRLRLKKHSAAAACLHCYWSASGFGGVFRPPAVREKSRGCTCSIRAEGVPCGKQRQLRRYAAWRHDTPWTCPSTTAVRKPRRPSVLTLAQG